MLERETLNAGTKLIDIETEIEFPSINNMKTVIPYNSSWNKLLIQVSGGLDSSLLLFLTAKAFKDLNSQVSIVPLSLNVPSKIKNLSSARKVIQKVRELTGYAHLQEGIEIDMPLEKSYPPEKDEFFRTTIYNLFQTEKLDFEFNGNTRNPPREVRNNFRDDDARELIRDYRTTIYNGKMSASPHSFNDKSGIVYLYKQEGILDELSSLTISCDINIDELEERGMPIEPCRECWWCRERQWGFDSNNCIDKSHFKSS